MLFNVAKTDFDWC